MNQIHNPATPDGNRSIADRRMTIDYDDGNPATIAPRNDRSMPAIAVDRADRAATPRRFRAPLVEIGRNERIDYDDGDPATIVAEARGFE